MSISFPTSDFAGMSVEEINSEKLLAHAAEQARDRRYDDLFIVDTDSHHYENYSLREIVEYLDDPVLRQLGKAGITRGGGLGGNLLPGAVGFQDMGGRISRLTLMATEKTPEQRQRDAVLARRWMDSMGVDVAISFPTPMLVLNTHPQLEMQTRMAWAYNRWLIERVLAEEPRLRGMLYLPLNDPEAALGIVRELGDKKGIAGFMVSATHNVPIYDNVYMRLYAEIEERGLAIGFHGGFDWRENAFRSANRFITIHALGFCFHNILHLTNWIVNGLPERFPKLKVIWIESGLAWVPWIMQRLDNEYMMRSNEAPALKMLPSDYMRQMYYTSQPMEVVKNIKALEVTCEMMHAETQLLFSSDYPHWDFDLPSTIYDLPFLSDTAKRNILGQNARRLFNITDDRKLAQIPPEKPA
jgi:predicted TIM-barrel fold metal-dependent hydrolase